MERKPPLLNFDFDTGDFYNYAALAYRPLDERVRYLLNERCLPIPWLLDANSDFVRALSRPQVVEFPFVRDVDGALVNDSPTCDVDMASSCRVVASVKPSDQHLAPVFRDGQCFRPR